MVRVRAARKQVKMQVSAHVDDLAVGQEVDAEVNVLVELTSDAPVAPADDRPGATVVVVLDNSRAMPGYALDGALTALAGLVQRLDSRDNLGVVSLASPVRSVVPLGPLTDKEGVVDRLAHVEPEGPPDLEAAYRHAVAELAALGCSDGLLVVLSQGDLPTDATASLHETVRRGVVSGVRTLTVGCGFGLEHSPLETLAELSGGVHRQVETPDEAWLTIARHVPGLVLEAEDEVWLSPQLFRGVACATLYDDADLRDVAHGEALRLDPFHVGERRKLLLRLPVPALPTLGFVRVARLDVHYRNCLDGTRHVARVPVTVNVVDPHEVDQWMPDPYARAEMRMRQALGAARQGWERYQDGDTTGAGALLEEAWETLQSVFEAAPGAMRGEVQREVERLRCARELLVRGRS
jgi:Ca-activated chloride channel family protein